MPPNKSKSWKPKNDKIDWRIRSLIGAWYSIIGFFLIVSGIGLFLLKNWARQLWLGVLILSAGISFYWSGSDYKKRFLAIPDLFGYFIIGVLIATKWFYLNKSQTDKHFTTLKS